MDNKFYLRPSSLQGFWDCERRYAIRQYTRKFEELGYIVAGDKRNAGSGLGTSIHVAFNFVLKGYEAGKDLTEEEVADVAIEDYEKNNDEDTEFTSALNSKDKVIKKIKVMAPSVLKIAKEIEVDALDVFAERKFKYQNIEVSFRGTADVITKDDLIVDLKTGVKKPKTSWLQYCGYNFLFKEKRPVRGLKEFFISSTKAENNETKVYDSKEAMPIFAQTLDNILTKTNQFFDEKKIEVFKVNPQSVLCSKKYCKAYNTEACPVSKYIESTL